MRKSCFFVFLAFLFFVSCSNGDDPLMPCVTVLDCPDSSYSCFDGFCVHTAGIVDSNDSDNDNSSENTVPDGDKNDGDSSSENGDNNNDGDSGQQDPVKPDDDGNSESQSDKDNAETSDSDGTEGGDDFDTSDTTDTVDTADTADTSDTTDTTDTADTADTSDTTDTTDTTDTADTSDTTDTGDSGHNVEEPVGPAACAAAIAALPHGGKYDWDDGTTQGFSTNTYWNLIDSSVIAARSGSYSFGKYSQYTVNKDQVSPLSTATDLSQCAQCTVKASFYVKGKICNDNCEAQTFLHPVCNGEGNTDVIDKTETILNQWTMPPSSPWVCDEWNDFKAKANNNQYSAVAWKDLEWTIPAACKTNQFVFGLRFRSSSGVPGPGLVVDDLTIYAATKNEPKGEFESAENGKISGWACDPDAYSEKVPVKVRYYKNKNESVVAAERSIDAEIERTSLTQCGGTYNHGFEIPFDAELAGILGVGTHSAAVFIGDLPSDCAGTYKKIGTKEFEITSLDPKKQ